MPNTDEPTCYIKHIFTDGNLPSLQSYPENGQLELDIVRKPGDNTILQSSSLQVLNSLHTHIIVNLNNF